MHTYLDRHWEDYLRDWSLELRVRHRELTVALIRDGFAPETSGRIAVEKILADLAEQAEDFGS
jgi:hypothetical protein